MDDKQSKPSSNSAKQDLPHDFPQRVDVTATEPGAAQHPRVRTEGATQQPGARGQRDIPQPGRNQRLQLTAEQFTKYRNSTPEHRQSTSEGDGGSGKTKQKLRVAFNFMCGKCTRVVCAGKDVRVFLGEHHPVLDPTFVERIKVYRHWKPRRINERQPCLRRPIELRKKISCVDCGCDWGTGCTIDDKYFFFIKVDTLKVECSGKVMTYAAWKYLPYHMDTISDSELMQYGHTSIPEDSPWPEGWY